MPEMSIIISESYIIDSASDSVKDGSRFTFTASRSFLRILSRRYLLNRVVQKNSILLSPSPTGRCTHPGISFALIIVADARSSSIFAFRNIYRRAGVSSTIPASEIYAKLSISSVPACPYHLYVRQKSNLCNERCTQEIGNVRCLFMLTFSRQLSIEKRNEFNSSKEYLN